MLDWLIVGGGVHGTIIAHALLAYSNSAGRLCVLDPNPAPLAVWNRLTRSCGMRYLRSPAAHATVPDFTGLLAWARRNGYDLSRHTIPPYARPSLELFNAHARAMLGAGALSDRWVQGRAVAIARAGRGWSVETDAGTIESRRVVLALGRSDRLRVPRWASGRDARIVHLFEPGFDREAACSASAPAIVGGGVSAAHLALFLASRGARPLIIARHELRVHQFDSDPCYLGPSCMRGYLAETDPERRRAVLRAARRPGSIPPDLHVELMRAVRDARVEFALDEVTRADRRAEGETVLHGRKRDYRSDRVILATGFEPGPPGRSLIDAPAAARNGAGSEFPTDSVGFPIPAPSLEWAPGLYVTGSLGEQELGPSAPNIIGAHNSAKRIMSHLGGKTRTIPAAWRRYAPASVSSSSASC